MNPYQHEQYEAHDLVLRHLVTLSAEERRMLESRLIGYLDFRERVDTFLGQYFANTCTQSCYQSRRSACCSREGIITFFADVVINVLRSPSSDVALLMDALQRPNSGFKCIYLTPEGCMWNVKPIVCAMFLCDSALRLVFDANPSLQPRWEAFRQEKNRFTWPDQPVLFDELETYFIKAGCTSTLMYMHNSPGLLRVKQQRTKRHKTG